MKSGFIARLISANIFWTLSGQDRLMVWKGEFDRSVEIKKSKKKLRNIDMLIHQSAFETIGNFPINSYY